MEKITKINEIRIQNESSDFSNISKHFRGQNIKLVLKNENKDDK